MSKPDFIIIGAAKSGTTSLARYINAHPEIEVVGERLEFFGEYSNPRYGKISSDQYIALMSKPSNVNCLVGEKSVSYLYSKSAPREIEKMSPGAKLIVILRNPIDRAYSDYWHRRRTGVESLSFSEALKSEEGRIRSGVRFEQHYATYGLYSKYLKRYIEIFGKDQILLLFYEDLKENPESLVQNCLDFLGVSTNQEDTEYTVHNRGGEVPPLIIRIILRIGQTKILRRIIKAVLPSSLIDSMTSYLVGRTSVGDYPEMELQIRSELAEYFRESISELEEISDRDLGHWR